MTRPGKEFLSEPMNVEQLRRALADLPGDMPVVVEDCTTGWMENVAMYVAPAHMDRRISGNYLHPCHRDDADNCHALLMSVFGQSEENLVDITPHSAWIKVIDAELEVQQSHVSNQTRAIDTAPGQQRDPSAEGQSYDPLG
ncbi:hypothetical protein [Mycobacterium sp.]|uniref:hypothetical protein n=1 Tax=Mycobacterium sp. TaxID=1785 RepID=UPI0028BEDB05|nr:hypothetical protein [Mycobacterium sp.]